MNQPTHAIILAAGMGTRLRSLGHPGPKGSLALGNSSIIEESITRLQRAGIKRITIVTGYQSSYYDRLAHQRSRLIQTLHNPDFANSGSMYSLYLARHQVDGDFLLLESDLIYEQRALAVLLENTAPNLVLLSGQTAAGDEVYVETNPDQLLRAMSKDKSRLGQNIAGELVGISKISRELFSEMCAYASKHFVDDLHLDYETDALVAASDKLPIKCLTVTDLLWSEIDDESHYLRAQGIHTLIQTKEGSDC
ncbi:MAG: phosphocholine cytidylyltransferase family protein [Chromatiales bacterium]|jgi:2-aminoethylphosphonate-pyruvate transaminase